MGSAVVMAGEHGASEAAPKSTERLVALDALRGLTIALMILVNTSGDGEHTYALLQHARWIGLTLADVVFPGFLFMVGMSLVLSLSGRLRRGVSRGVLLRTTLRRAAILFAIGLLLNGFPQYHLGTLRIFGVLQRIALCSVGATVLFLWLRPRGIVAVTASILLGYWILLRWVPVPGYGMPGVDVAYLDPHGNLAAWLDRALVPANHLYHQGYYDPEGLLSSVAALATTLLGVLTGLAFLRPEDTVQRVRRLLVVGVAALAAGVAWSVAFPLSKRLWTSSFVLVNAGLDLVVLALLLWLLDARGERSAKARRAATPLLVFGMNSLAAYILSEFGAAILSALPGPSGAQSLQAWLFHPLAAMAGNLYVAAFLYAILFVVACYVPMAVLYRRRIFVKV